MTVAQHIAAPSLRFERPERRVVLGLITINILAHLLLVNRYGYHGDELYFIECGRHLAFGYVDHAPLIPWIARLADLLGGASLFALRLPAIAASTGTMSFIALLVREWGGRARAQGVALLSFLFAPAHLRLAGMLNIPVVEVFLCSAASYLIARALARSERRTWLVVGAVLGLALLAKHTVLLWGAALVIGVLATPQRHLIATVWPWLGLLVAGGCLVPNLLWQAELGFPTLEFVANLRRDIVADHGRVLFALGQLLYFHPVVVAVWVSGLTFAFREQGRAARPFAVLFLVMFGVLFVLGGKPYYLASAYPPVLAAGGVALERWLERRGGLLSAFFIALCGVGVPLAVLTLPLLPIRTVDAAIERLLGRVIPPIALTHDMHGELGWEVHVATITQVVDSLSPNEQATASILTASYAQAAALNVLRKNPKPRAVSGHMNYYLWGPEPRHGAVLIAYGIPRQWLTRHYARVEERARIVAPLARPWDTDLPAYLCREPRQALSAFWSELRRYDHRL